MKRDLDLIRNMLLIIEDSDKNSTLGRSDFSSLSDNPNILDYHLYLLADAGYVDYVSCNLVGYFYPQILIKWMTNDGCDYLDSIRSASVWDKTKEQLAKIGGQASFDIVKTIAEHVALSFLDI